MKLNRLHLIWLFLSAGLLVAPATGHAFAVSGGGGKVGYLTPEHGDGTAALGAHLELEQPGTRWHLMPGFMVWNDSRMTGLNANFDVYYHFDSQARVSPYLGTGLGLSHVDVEGPGRSDTGLAANLFGGVRFPDRASHFFVEGRHTMSDVAQTSLLGGITFH